MDKHDLDLISALAAGSLPPAEAAALEARLASDPEAVTELAQQRRALAAIARSARPRLAEAERSALRIAVASRLGLEAGVGRVDNRRRVPWGAVAVGASALVAIIALAPVVGLIGDRGGDDAATVADGGGATTRIGDIDLAPAGADAPAEVADTLEGDASVGEEYASTTQAALVERAGDVPKVAQDLALLAADPEAVQLLEQPTDPDTACLLEAQQYFGTDQFTWFEFPDPADDEDSVTYVVFHLAAIDDTTGLLVAFDPADCTIPIEVPES